MLNWNDVIKFANHGNPSPPRLVVRTDKEWQKVLTPDQFRVTRTGGTEPKFSGEYCTGHEPGLYTCMCCEHPLFDSREKFDSRSGWPSFMQSASSDAIKYIKDGAFGMRRIEVRCNVCDSHLGHIFPDGPGPSGLRYCINSISLNRKTEQL